MKKGDYVRIVKIASTPWGIPACPMPLYSPGAWDGIFSLPREYWMDGYLAATPAVAHRILLCRDVRCGVVARGFFKSSLISRIRGNLITTHNSIWQVSRVPALRLPAADEQPLL